MYNFPVTPEGNPLWTEAGQNPKYRSLPTGHN